jgi:hypothetical protein
MTDIQKELRAATHASLRAHPISNEAEALVSTLATMVNDHALATRTRKNNRRSSAQKLAYAVGAFLADLLRPLDLLEPKSSPWVYRSMHAKSFTGASVPYRTFAPLVDSLEQLGLLQHVDGHKVSCEPEDTGKYAARFRATPALLAFCSDRAVDPAKVHDHFEFEYDLPTDVIELRATKKGEYWVKTKPAGEPMDFDRDGVVRAIGDRVMELNEFFAQQKLRGASPTDTCACSTMETTPVSSGTWEGGSTASTSPTAIKS